MPKRTLDNVVDNLLAVLRAHPLDGDQTRAVIDAVKEAHAIGAGTAEEVEVVSLEASTAKVVAEE